MTKTVVDLGLGTCICSECGILFAMPNYYQEKRRQDHEGFYCPNGHFQYYPQKSEAEKLRAELAEEKRKLANAQFELMAAEKKTKRLEKRIKNGICPCCHRQFVQLTRHMKTKHPEYQKG